MKDFEKMILQAKKQNETKFISIAFVPAIGIGFIPLKVGQHKILTLQIAFILIGWRK